MSPEQRKKLEELLGRLVSELPEGDADDVVTELIRSLHENVRRYAWLQILDIPETVRDDKMHLHMMALVDTGIEAGADAMMRALLVRPPLETQPEVPSYRKELKAESEKILKTDPGAAERHRQKLKQYGMDLPETTIGDL